MARFSFSSLLRNFISVTYGSAELSDTETIAAEGFVAAAGDSLKRIASKFEWENVDQRAAKQKASLRQFN